MKRPLICAAGGFVLGEVCVLLPVGWFPGILVLMTAGVCYLWRKGKGRGRSWLWWILPLFLMLGMGRMLGDQKQTAWRDQVLERMEGKNLELEGDVASIGYGERSMSLKLRNVVLRDRGEISEYPSVLVYVDYGTRQGGQGEISQLRIGMRVLARGELEGFKRPGNPGEFDYGAYYHALGIEGRMYSGNIKIVCQEYSPYLDGIYRLKEGAGKILKGVCSQEDLGVFQAVVLGEKQELSGEIQKLYQKNGIAHLLAVSGLHVSLIGMGIYSLLRKAGLGFGKAGMTAAVVTISYGILTGGSASVVRAVVMLCLQLLAARMGRTYDMLSAMAVAALLLLAQSPSYLFQSGFQLSFGAVLAIGSILPVLIHWLEAKSRWEKTLLLNGVIQMVTCPVIVYHYFEYPVYGMALNLVVIPLLGYVLLSGLAGIGLGAAGGWLGAAGILPEGTALWAGEMAIGTGHYILALYQRLCTGFLKVPGAVQIVGRPRLWQIGVYGGVWLLIVAAAWKSQEKGSAVKESKGERDRGRESKGEGSSRCGKHGERNSGKGKIWRMSVLLAGMAVGWILLKAPSQEGFKAVFLDVGQGDGICLRTEETVILVDCGSSDEKRLGEQVVEPFLKSQGISQIDYAIVSHGDKDHISGLSYLLESSCGIRIKHLVLPWLGKEDQAYKGLVELAKEMGVNLHWMKEGDSIREGELELQCLYAGQEGRSQDRNEHSLFIQAGYGETGILLTGDMSEEGEMEWLRQEKKRSRAKGSRTEKAGVQILKAAHHGSAYSSCEEFLKYIDPDCVVISCGQGNRYGHPSPETVKRLEEQGIQYLVTMEHGAVTVETDGRKVTIR